MASGLAFEEPRLLTAAELLDVQFPPDVKAEFDRGVIRVIGGGSTGHARVQMNLYRSWAPRCAARDAGPTARMRGSRRRAVDPLPRPYRRLRPAAHRGCAHAEGPARRDGGVLPRHPGTRAQDEGTKLAQYQALPSVDTIVLIDPAIERVRVLQRAGPEEWRDRRHADPAEVVLPSIGLAIPHAEIFARD